jgi:hypothetical protein
VLRYMSYNFILGVAFSSVFANQNYITFDIFSRYDFGTSEQILYHILLLDLALLWPKR